MVTDGRTNRQTDRQTDRRTDAGENIIPHQNGGRGDNEELLLPSFSDTHSRFISNCDFTLIFEVNVFEVHGFEVYVFEVMSLRSISWW